MTTFRILSNIQTHGAAYAIEHEAKRLQRKGYSKLTAVSMAWAMINQLQS
jgi:hypothetical protein